MKTKHLLISIFFLATGVLFAQKNSTVMYYTNMWHKIDSLNKKSFPQSALDEVKKIYDQALKEKNSPQVIKSLLYKSSLEAQINSDSAIESILETESYLKSSTDKVEKSVLYSILAEMYSNYYSSQQYKIRQRTEVTGYVPNDIREWTKGNFQQKVIFYVWSSMQDAQILQTTNALNYEPILETGKDSRSFRPTLYDFLSYRGIDILNRFYDYQKKSDNTTFFLPVAEFIKTPINMEKDDATINIINIYQRLLAFRYSNSNKEALLMADLDRLDFAYSDSETDEKNELYLSALNKLEKEWQGKDISVEILYKKAMFYINEQPPVIYKTNAEEKKADINKNQKVYDICAEGINKYPTYKRIGLLKNLQKQITEPYIQTSSNNCIYPGKELELKINYQNVNDLTIQIYKINTTNPVAKDWGESARYKTNGTLIQTVKVELPTTLSFEKRDTLVKIPVKETGLYEYVLSNNKKMVSNSFAVTELAAIVRNKGNNNVDFLVTDRISGKPIENATVQLYENIYDKNPIVKKVITTDKDGIAYYSGDKGYQGYSVISEKNKSGFISNMPWGRGYDENNEPTERVSILTDRSIYRPGQTVFFKAIAWKSGENVSTAIPNKKYEVTFKDANWQDIATKSFTTNEFGSISGEFVIPQQVRSGSFSITTTDATAYITVSEYKRPTFKIDFQPIEGTYSFGDAISVKGNAQSFSGVPLQSVQLNYRVVRRPHFLYRWLPNWNEKQITQGVTFINDDGSFTVSFKTDKDKSDLNNDTYYTYEILASITDLNGETQEGSQYVSVGDKSMYMTFAFAENIDKTKSEHLKLTAQNLNNAPLQIQGNYTLYSLIDETSLEKTKTQPEIDVYTGRGTLEYKINKEVLSGKFSTPDSIPTDSWKNLSSGRYQIIAKALDNKGKEITEERDFVLYSPNDKKSPILTYNWLLKEKITCKVGENAEVILGTSAKDVYVLYEIFKKNQIVERKRISLNKENKKLLIPYKAEYGDNVTLALTYIKDESVFANTIPLNKEMESKNLNLKFEVFRNKLQPGQKEEWKLTVKDDNANPAVAELLAGMYDASLDKIQPHSWQFNPREGLMYYYYNFNEGNDFRQQNAYLSFDSKYVETPDFKFDALINVMMRMYNRNQNIRIRGTAMKAEEGAILDEVKQVETVGSSMAPAPQAKLVGFASNVELREATVQDTGGGSQEKPEVQIRQNFNETAFFFPQLKTNEKGETVISFTVPESTTTWKFMGLAHTKDLKFGQITKETVTQKDLMVTPNLPRFLRQGDKTSISAKISNLSDKNLQGKVKLELFNPENDKIIISVDNAEQPFNVNAAGSTSANWTFTVPESIQIVGCRVIAQNEQFSDGEQHLLPVLSNRILVTESMPITLRSNQTKTESFDKLINNQSTTLDNYRLTLEFTGNPAWYAVQALPSLANPASDNAISWFSSYYVNTLAGYIARSNPEIKKVVDVWQKQGSSKETLLSSLEKNEELKSVLLQETPWVLDAKNETEQKQQLSLLFDINRQSQLTSDALQKLADLQNENGGWMWFKGMYPSRYVSTYILENMYRLIKLNAVEYGEREKQMQIKALNYLDKEIVKDYTSLKKNTKDLNKEMYINDMQMYYLCVRSCYKDIPFYEGALEAYKYYSGQAEKYRNKLTLYGKAQASIFFKREGKTAVASELIQSLKEHSTTNEEMGMFWANNNSGYFWNQSAIAVQTTILEAFSEAGNSNNDNVEEMKIWLLKQKQTQAWDAVPSTVNAIYALLLNGKNLLSNSNDVNIQLGNKKIDTNNEEAGTGYIKQSFDKQEITSQMGKVTATKTGEGIAWGALYWQYFEDLNKITKQGGALSVEKLLFVERTTDKGKAIEPVTSTNLLKVGDKAIIRLTVRTDRDLEYVHLKDLRAACFEPTEQLSGFRWKEQVGYYQDNKDVSTNFYFDYLPKGTYVFEYSVWVNRVGEYSTGIANIQCMYAPEFVSHSEGGSVQVKN